MNFYALFNIFHSKVRQINKIILKKLIFTVQITHTIKNTNCFISLKQFLINI